jgi:DNA-binding winged helix-turn-helix (wHTH) protein
VPGINSSVTSLRFAEFELTLDGELLRDGNRVKLAGQPIIVLQILLECPGSVVTRGELQKRIWPSESFGDFNQGLNAAIQRLRDALGDSASTPRFIETVPRRGYRFIGRIQGQEAPPIAPPISTSKTTGCHRPRWVVEQDGDFH